MTDFVDDIHDALDDMNAAVRERYAMLKHRAQEGKLNERERAELSQLKRRFENHKE